MVTYTHNPNCNPRICKTEAGTLKAQGQPQLLRGSRLALAREKTNLGTAAEITGTAQGTHLKGP